MAVTETQVLATTPRHTLWRSTLVMFAALARDFRLARVTFSLLALSVAFFLGVEWYRTVSNDPLAGRGTFGSVEPLLIRGEEELHGPFDLWEGPWWRWLRVPASAFHHR